MKISEYKIDAVKPYHNNPRINNKTIDSLAASISEFGFRQPIVVDRKNTIICGHARYLAAIKLGLQSVPVHCADTLTDDQAKAYRIADNKIAELSEWDWNKLEIEIQDLDLANFDLNILAFSEQELFKLLKGKSESSDDDAPPISPDIISKLGESYQLGVHKLHCGDSTDGPKIRRFLKCNVDMVFTDPPYNMNYQSKNLGGIQNDRMSESQFVQFILKSAFTILSTLKSGASFYICMSALEYPLVYHQLRKIGMAGRQLIWVKPSPGLGAQEYRPQYEVMLYGYVGSRAERTWNGKRGQSDLWDIAESDIVIAREDGDGMVLEIGGGIETTQVCLDRKCKGSIISFNGESCDLWRFGRENGQYVHPTQKPVVLIERAIRNSSNKNDVVLDTFGGSGSTVIACEKLGRKCFVVEIDPQYCDVIRRRWAEFVYGKNCNWENLTPIIKDTNEGN